MTNWKEYEALLEEFTEEITQQWIEKGFSKEELKATKNKEGKNSLWKQPSTYFTFLTGVGLILLVILTLIVARKKKK